MADLIVGTTAVVSIRVLNLDGTAVSGLTNADLVPVLRRRTGTGAYGAASEVITVTERTFGVYEFSWVLASDSDGYIYWLTVTEQNTYALSAQRTHDNFRSVSSESQVYTESDAFCSLADVQSWVQRGAFGATSVPTSAHVINFMAQRASELEAVMAINGAAYTVSTGSSPLPSSTTTIGRVLGNMLRIANAQAAAADAILSFEVKDSSSSTEIASHYLKSFEDMQERIANYIRGTISTRTFMTSSSNVRSDTTLYTIDGTVF